LPMHTVGFPWASVLLTYRFSAIVTLLIALFFLLFLKGGFASVSRS
jgi:hypothetical protein